MLARGGAWAVRTDSRAAVIGLAIGMLALLSACNGRDAWKQEPLPDHGPADPPAALPEDGPRVRLETDFGDIVIALYPNRAPVSTRNFLRYARSGFYDGTIFHRITRGRMNVVQGGGFEPGLEEKETGAPIENEADNGLSNVRGTVAMARSSEIDSATAQFFINVTDNLLLDHRGPSPREFGYAVFGFVVEGLDVVDRISMAPTERVPGTPHANVPMEPIVIGRVRRAVVRDGRGGAGPSGGRAGLPCP